MHHLYSPNTRVIPELYDSNNDSAVTVTMTIAGETFKFSQKWVFTSGVLEIFTLIHFESFPPKNLIQDLVSSVPISLTDSCSPCRGFRVKYHDRWQRSEAFLFTHRQGWKEQRCYRQLVNILWRCSLSSEFSLGLFIFWICRTKKKIWRAVVPKWFKDWPQLAAGTAGGRIMI